MKKKCCRLRLPHQTLRQWRLVTVGQMLLQGQDDAVGDDGGENHPLKWSEGSEFRKNDHGQTHGSALTNICNTPRTHTATPARQARPCAERDLS